MSNVKTRPQTVNCLLNTLVILISITCIVNIGFSQEKKEEIPLAIFKNHKKVTPDASFDRGIAYCYPDWSEKGDFIVCIRNESIVKIELEELKMKEIYKVENRRLGNPILFDDNIIYFVEEIGVMEAKYFLWSINLDGSDKKKVLDKYLLLHEIKGADITKQIVLIVENGQSTFGKYHYGDGNAKLLDLKTGALTNLPVPSDKELRYPYFSSDGRMLVYNLEKHDVSFTIGLLDLMTMRYKEFFIKDGTGRYDAHFPTIIPGTNYITYFADEARTHRPVLWLMDITSGEKKQFMGVPSDIRTNWVAWSKDGKQICYQTNDGSLWIAELEFRE